MVLDSFRAAPTAFKVLMISALIENVAFGLIVPFLAIYMVNILNISKPLTGVALAGYTLSGIPGAIIGGMLTEKIGRRAVLLVSLGLMSLTMLLYFFAVDFVTLFMVVLADSFVGSLYMPAANAMIADVTPKQGRPKAYSTLRIAWNIGMFFGPALGIFIVTAFSVRELFVFGSVILAGAFAMNIVFIPETKPKDAEEQEITFTKFFQVSRNRTFLVLCALTGVIWFSFSQWMGVLLIYATSNLGLSNASASLVFMVNGAMVVTLQLWVTSKMIKFRRSLTLMTGQLIVAGGFSLLFFANDIPSLVACIVVITIGELIYMSIVSAIIADMSPDAERGLYMGFSGFIQSLGIGVGFFAGMWLLDVLQEPKYIWFIFGVITAIGSLGYILLGRMLGPERDLPKYQPEIIPVGTPPLEK
jgi:MFS family permease